ncbi:hypothetical protein [Campylobacter showae]|uniref:hypothetical protein n=1 Tax=Campylobacter showae TaxID=204 RepID=UPI000F079808|nr:hypothetical protein [Campylobacter showae]
MAKSNTDKIDFSGMNEGIEVTTSKNKKKKNNKTLWIAAIAVIAFGIFAQMKINSQEQNQESKQAPQTAQKQEQNSSQIPTSKNNTESDISKSIPSDYPKNELTDQNSTDGQDVLDTQKDQIIANVQKEIKNVATDKTDKNVGQDELSWKRRTASFFNNEGQMQFILDAEVPSVIANNFKQEAQNQYRIAGTDAKISNISFAVPENRSDFLSIKFIIESIDTPVTYRIEKFYPFSKYAKLKFFDDAVIKTVNGDEIIIVEGDNIYPYIKLLQIGKDEQGTFAILEVNQSKFNAESFIYEYRPGN